MTAKGYTMLPAALIDRAAAEVPHQLDLGDYASWCCGPNSALRACIMLGRSAPDVHRFIGDCAPYRPLTDLKNLGGGRYGIFLSDILSALHWIPDLEVIGPTPEGLRDYLHTCDSFRGLGARAVRVDHWHEMLDSIRRSMNACRPVIALVIWEELVGHYVCIVGMNEIRGLAAILNTDGGIYEMPLRELRHQMNARDTVPFTFDIFNAYNAVDFPDDAEPLLAHQPRTAPQVSAISPPATT